MLLCVDVGDRTTVMRSAVERPYSTCTRFLSVDKMLVGVVCHPSILFVGP